EPGHFPAAVAAHMLAWGKGSMLYRDLVRTRRLAQDVTAFAFPVVVGAGTLVVWATARPGVDPETLEAALLEGIAGLERADDADVERAVNLIEARHLTDLQRVDERADLLSMFTALFDEPERLNTELD